MSYDTDICIVGSGAGAGPVAYEMAMAGRHVTVLEKGPWLTEKDFYKDEMACCRRDGYTPDLDKEPQVIVDKNSDGEWETENNRDTGWNFWNGNMVGGSSNLMSGYFHRMKPVDFRLLSEFGPIDGANIVDWPVTYDEMEPYYTKVENIVGVSGKVMQHPFLEPRSTPDFPFPALTEHPITNMFDDACNALEYNAFPLPRAILSRPFNNRQACVYSGYCGSYGCNTKAKGSSRAALLNAAVETGKCQVIPHAKVYKIKSDWKGNASHALYFDSHGKRQKISAKTFVVACQAVETSRLLLLSDGLKHPNGMGNHSGQVGKNLIFSAGGVGRGDFHEKDLGASRFAALKTMGPFVNRAIQDWYVINDHKDFNKPVKGGTVDFLLDHNNPIRKAVREKWKGGKLNWGKSLKSDLAYAFHKTQRFQFEIFCDWSPNDNCHVGLSKKVKDYWGTPVSKIKVGHINHDLKIGEYIADKSEKVLETMGARNVYSSVSGSPPTNLMAGGCRFGNNPDQAVLDKDCRVYGTENVFVTDGSFMPTGGSVTYTWTIYANAFRVADILKKQA